MERLVVKSKAGSLYYNDTEQGVKLEPHEITPHQRRLLLERLHVYEDTGLTPPEIMDLKERDTAKAPEEIQDAYGDTRLICPNCGAEMMLIDRNRIQWGHMQKYCGCCGQAIDKNLEGMENE